jgi:uncharacterized protein
MQEGQSKADLPNITPMNLTKLNRITHRDIGYLIAGLTIIYAISGISLNHKNNWNPNYIIDSRSFNTSGVFPRESFNNESALNILKLINEEKNFKAYNFPTGNKVTIFIEGGFVQVNSATGEGVVQKISKRPVFYQLNFLHYNPGRLWKYFSDIFCISLILVSVTGLFIIKGKNGITRRGAILTIIGILLPLIFLFIY